jgi:adenine-specific DNA-methyltransferase
MKELVEKKYKTIVGNPPYVRTKTGNLYIDFTEKCYNLLEDNGELIFVIPSDFFKLTSSAKLLDKMLKAGTFTHIYHPHNEKLFKDASIDVSIFRYCKNKEIKKEVVYNDDIMFITNRMGMLTFSKGDNVNCDLFKTYFDIYVGLVSGKEEVFKNDKLGNIEVINGENKLDKYIFITMYPTNNVELNSYMLKNKEMLINRKIRKFDEDNWFEWGAPRNISSIDKYRGNECIYILNLTRKSRIAFIGSVMYFGGGLLMLRPKKKYNTEFMKNVINYLNSEQFKNNFMFSGRFKIGHRQISNSTIPNEISSLIL